MVGINQPLDVCTCILVYLHLLRVLQYTLKLDLTHKSWHPNFLLSSSLDPVRVVKCYATDWAQVSVLGLPRLNSGFHTGLGLSREESRKGSEDDMVPA